MAQSAAQPSQFVNVIAISIIILPFLTTEALDRIDRWDDDGWQAYLKIGTTFALFLAFFITVLVASLVLNIAGQVIGGIRITAAYFLFVALYLPTLGLLVPPIVEATDLAFSPELNQWIVLGVLLGVGIAAALLINANPVP